jgi:gliding motility-associated-like protein
LPTSGCNLSGTSGITIIVSNLLATPFLGSFDISYSLNGAIPVSETVGPIVMGGLANYIKLFITPADLSPCQVHTFDFVCAVVGDLSPWNNSCSTTITSDCATVPGTIIGPDTVCSGINSGNLVLSGNNGNPENWLYSITGGPPFTWISNTTPTQPYSNISDEMVWKVIVGSPFGLCADDTTLVDTIRVVPQSNPGNLPANFDICDNGNGGELNLTGYLGNVLNWSYSQDDGTTWGTIANTTDSLLYSNLLDTTLYRVLVKNNICPAVYSLPVTMNLIPGSDAGSIVGEFLVCNFENDSTLEVNPVVGSAVDWAISIDNGTTWNPLGIPDSLCPYSGLQSYTLFAAFVQEATCPYDTAYWSIVVLPIAPSAGPNISIFEEDSTQLMASGGSFFNWFPANYISDPAIQNPVVWPLTTTTYYVSITDVNGCSDTASVLITVLENILTIVVPNLLTPNSDGFNDYLSITNIDTYPNNELHIFNSYGQVIYQASPYTNDWYATFGGSQLPDGTYFYILNLNDPVNAPDPYQGVITILGNE